MSHSRYPELSVDRRRFVVLRHHPGPNSVRTAEVHLDWMFESSDSLLTWATRDLKDPLDSHAELVAQRLPDHRKAYLEYQGPVTGGRGSVQRLVFGSYTVREQSAGLFALDLSLVAGQGQLLGRMTIQRSNDASVLASDVECWVLSVVWDGAEASRWVDPRG